MRHRRRGRYVCEWWCAFQSVGRVSRVTRTPAVGPSRFCFGRRRFRRRRRHRRRRRRRLDVFRAWIFPRTVTRSYFTRVSGFAVSSRPLRRARSRRLPLPPSSAARRFRKVFFSSSCVAFYDR